MMTTTQRDEHLRRIAPHGGRATADKYPSHHFRAIGKAGAQATIQKHGYGYLAGILKAKGWQGRRQESLVHDLAVGAVYAEWSFER